MRENPGDSGIDGDGFETVITKKLAARVQRVLCLTPSRTEETDLQAITHGSVTSVLSVVRQPLVLRILCVAGGRIQAQDLLLPTNVEDVFMRRELSVMTKARASMRSAGGSRRYIHARARNCTRCGLRNQPLLQEEIVRRSSYLLSVIRLRRGRMRCRSRSRVWCCSRLRRSPHSCCRGRADTGCLDARGQSPGYRCQTAGGTGACVRSE